MSKLLVLFFLISFIRFLLLILLNKSKTVSNSFSSTLISFLATCGYLLPIQQNLEYYGNVLNDIPIIKWLLPDRIDYKLEDSIIMISPNDTDVLTQIIDGISQYGSFIVFFCIYFIVIKNGKKYNIDYFIRYNVMSGILISLLQVPITYLYVQLNGFTTLNPFLAVFIENLATSLILLNFLIMSYAIYYSITNKYLILPIVTDACELHVGKKE